MRRTPLTVRPVPVRPALVLRWSLALLIVAAGLRFAPRSLEPDPIDRDEAFLAVVPGGASLETRTLEARVVHAVAGRARDPLGWAFRAADPRYEVVALVGLDAAAATIVGVRLLESAGAPGLGDRVAFQAALDRFLGQPAASPLRPEFFAGGTLARQAVLTALAEEIGSAGAAIRRELARSDRDERFAADAE